MDNPLNSPPSEGDDEIRSAISSVSETNWKNFFEMLRQNEYAKLRGSEDPNEVRSRVKALDTIQVVFIAIKQTKKKVVDK